MKTSKTRTVHFVFSLRVFVSAHVIITSIAAPGLFKSICLVLLLLLAGSLVPKFHFQLTKKKPERSPGKGQTQYNLAYGVTALAPLYALYSHSTRSFNQWQHASYSNFIINFHKARALRHTSALLRYNARSLRHRYEHAQFTIHFIKEIKRLVPGALLNYISNWEYLRTLEKCEKHFSRVLNNSRVLI